MYKKHSIEERRLAVKLCCSGLSLGHVSRKMGIDRHDIRIWLTKYKLMGEAGLQKTPHKHLNFEEKCEIVCEHLEKSVSLREICVKYNISHSRVRVWCRIVRERGYEGLRKKKNRGRPPKNKDMGRPKKREPQTELEKLQRELEYLRAENAYLKKLRALVLEKEAQKRKNEL